MRNEIIRALLEKPIKFIKEEELLIATEEEIRHALAVVPPNKSPRIKAFNMELHVREKPASVYVFNSKNEENAFAREWKRTVALFKH